MTPSEAGQLARQAAAQRLVLTHYSDEIDSDWVHSEAVRSFGGEVALAQEGAEYTV
jgi:ribonuclease BN (tRNA processing enzyme)